MNWYAVYTKAGREDAAAETLVRGGFEVYAPRLRARRYLRGQYRAVVEPMFPCYVFVRMDPVAHLWMVNYTRGVRKVVGSPDAPWPVSDGLIEMFRSREKDGLITARDEDIGAGDAVRIADGPFAGLEAVFERPLKGSERAVLLLKAIEYQLQVVVERSSLVRVG